MSPPRTRLVVLISGTGRSLANLLQRGAAGWPVDVIHVVSGKAGVAGLDIARAAGIPTSTVARRDFPDTAGFSAALDATILPLEPDLVVMAGFLSLYHLPAPLQGRVINIHPSLLPLFGGQGFYGHRVHEAVLASGMRVSGCTVHFVDNLYDNGRIIVQHCCPVRPDDTADALAQRVFAAECVALPEAIDLLRTGAVRPA